MKYVNNWGALEPYGLHLLTGEACGLMYRLLFDVTRQGQKVLEKCLGVTLMLAEPWNSGSPDDPHLGSILLPQSMFLPLGVFALLETGCTEVWQVGEGLIGFEPTDSAEQRERTALVYAERRGRIFRYAGTAGDRNVHMMSGRVA
jgi:hypothetical protein